MARMLAAVAWALLCLCGPARTQTIAFTFDDGFDPRRQPMAAVWNARMLDALAAADVKAMLFPAGRNVDSPDGLALVLAWSDAGHAIGNHTWSHRSLGSATVSLADFTADVLADQRLLSGMSGWTRRLRFPYLKEGATEAKRDGMRAWMQQNHYRSAPVSIDTSDWYYSERFVAWQGDPIAFRDAYLAHLWSRALYYDKLARDVTGRSPAHVMLLHANAINAAFLPDVIGMFRARGWTIVDPVRAFDDPLYAMLPTVLPAGESIVWSLAKEQGHGELRYPAEDDVYEKPLLDRLGSSVDVHLSAVAP